MSAKNHMEAVYQLLSSDAGVTALVGSKIYPITEPETEGYPAIIYSQLNDDKIKSKDGPIDNGKRFTLEIYSQSYGEAHSIGRACEAVLGWYEGTVSGTEYHISLEDQQDMDYEEKTQTFGIVQDYSLEFD